MSHAFIREQEEQWLHEVAPTMNALMSYLARENNNIRVYEKESFPDPKTGQLVHLMSNGLRYALDHNRQWSVVG
jgi:hypothetical protein